MKPARFTYARPTSVPEAVGLLRLNAVTDALSPLCTEINHSPVRSSYGFALPGRGTP